MNNNESCIKACNKLLRGELSAINAYTKALNGLSDASRSGPLEQILSDHRDSAEVLRSHLIDMGAVPDPDAGAWGTFTSTVQGAAVAMGDSVSLASLKEGEEHGIGEYEEALGDEDVMDEAKAAIRRTLLPRLVEHITVLEGLRAA